MASAGKKGKKSKAKSIPLQKFLAKDGDAIQEGYTVVTPKKVVDWAAEVENEDDNNDVVYSSRDKYILPSAPMGPNVDISKVPNAPPFTAFLGNLAYEIEKDDITAFFKDLKITMIRLPRGGGDTGRPRGFGYVEFEDRQSLIEALGMSDTHLRNGRVKIDVAENQEEPNRRRDNRGERSDRPERIERTAALSSDWRSSPREEPAKPEGRERSGFSGGGGGGENRERYNDRYSSDRDKDRYANQVFDRSSFGTDREKDYGGERERSSGFGGERERSSGFGGDRERSSGFGGDRERSSGFGGSGNNRGFSDREPRERQYDRGYNQDNRDSYNGYDRGGYDRGGRSNRREFGTGYRGDDRSDYSRGSYDRGNAGGGGGSGGGGYNDSNEVEEREPQEKELPKERPKLVLQKRTIPIQEVGQPVAPAAIFGGAKPVDTAAREREIDERLAKEAAAKLAAETLEKERDIRRDEYRSADAPENVRRLSSGAPGRSPRSSTSIPPSSDDGSHHSEGDEGGNRPASSKTAHLVLVSSDNIWSRRSSSNAQPLPPSSGGPRQRNSEVDDQHGRYNSYDHGGNERSYYRRQQSENTRDDRSMSRGRGGGSRGGNLRGNSYRSMGGDRREDRDGRGGYDDPPPRERRERDVEKPPREMPKFEGPKAPTYTSVNKFSGLSIGDDD